MEFKRCNFCEDGKNKIDYSENLEFRKCNNCNGTGISNYKNFRPKSELQKVVEELEGVLNLIQKLKHENDPTQMVYLMADLSKIDVSKISQKLNKLSK